MESCMRHLKCHIKRNAPDEEKHLIENLVVGGNDMGAKVDKTLVLKLHKIKDAGVNTINSIDLNETISPSPLDSTARLKFFIVMIVNFIEVIVLFCILLTYLNIFHCD